MYKLVNGTKTWTIIGRAKNLQADKNKRYTASKKIQQGRERK